MPEALPISALDLPRGARGLVVCPFTLGEAINWGGGGIRRGSIVKEAVNRGELVNGGAVLGGGG